MSPQQDQPEVAELSEPLDEKAAYEIAKTWIAQEIEGGDIHGDAAENDGNWYFIPAKGGTDVEHVLMDGAPIVVYPDGTAGWAEMNPDASVLDGIPEDELRTV